MPGYREFIERYQERCLRTLDRLPLPEIERLIALLEKARQEGRRIFLCGNGGSASMASHLAGELGKEASWGKEKRFKVHSLCDTIPWLTAIANDASYDSIFEEQLKNHAEPADLLIAFSTSGNSANVLRAVRWAAKAGLTTIGITGLEGGELARSAELVIRIESQHTGHIQEGHFLIQHLISYYFIQ